MRKMKKGTENSNLSKVLKNCVAYNREEKPTGQPDCYN